MLRKTILTALSIAALGLAAPEVQARGGFGGGHGGGGFHGGGGAQGNVPCGSVRQILT